MPKLLFTLIITITIWSCSKEVVDINSLSSLDYHDQLTKIEFLGAYNSVESVQFIQLANAPNQISTSTDFSLYRVQYKTRDFENKELIVSGLIGIPSTNNIKGMVSWQHGTNTYRPNSVSSPSTDEGIGIMALFAGDSFLTIAPDYIGLGTSTEIHPYYHMESTTNSIIDLVNIGTVILNHLTDGLNKNLYLAGFSQGAGASLATHRRLEKNPFTTLELKGTAAISGAYNLSEISIPYTIEKNHFNGVIYMGYAINAYAHIYNESPNSIIKEPYSKHIKDWFDGTKNASFLKDNLPPKVDQFVHSEFINDVKSGHPNWFIEALKENETYNWKPINPLRLYYGSNDIDVSPEDSKNTFNNMKNMNANVELLNLGPYDHDESIIQALSDIQNWFNDNN